MFALALAPRFSTSTPGILNTEGRVSFSMPLLNIGDAAAGNLRVTSITLGSATRSNPASFPLILGDLGATNSVSVNAVFANTGLLVGGKYLVTIRGSYESGGSTYGFAVNRYIIVPPPVAAPVRFLKSHTLVAVESGVWSYMLFNDEPLDSPLFIASFSLDIVAPISVIGVPEGWSVLTDNLTYVLWYATDTLLPYAHHVAPGASLGDFRIQGAIGASESTGFIVTGWNHQTDRAELTSPGSVLSPARS